MQRVVCATVFHARSCCPDPPAVRAGAHVERYCAVGVDPEDFALDPSADARALVVHMLARAELFSRGHNCCGLELYLANQRL
jgi:hypothetical protein